MDKQTFGFRLPRDLKAYLQKQADRHRTSVAHYIVTLILEDKKKDDVKNENSQIKTVTD